MNRVAEYAPDKEIFNPPHLDKFMQAVAYLQLFGTEVELLENKAKRTKESLLPRETTWLVDTDKYRPGIFLPSDPSTFDDAPFVQFLRSYKA